MVSTTHVFLLLLLREFVTRELDSDGCLLNVCNDYRSVIPCQCFWVVGLRLGRRGSAMVILS